MGNSLQQYKKRKKTGLLCHTSLLVFAAVVLFALFLVAGTESLNGNSHSAHEDSHIVRISSRAVSRERVHTNAKGKEICALPVGKGQEWQESIRERKRWDITMQTVLQQLDFGRIQKMNLVNMRLLQQGQVIEQRETMRRVRLLI